MIYGPKAGGVWPSGASLVGPTGLTGAAGAAGATGATGAAGDTTAVDKALADLKAATDAAASQGGGGAAMDKSVINTIKLIKGTGPTKTISLDLADKYGDRIVVVSVNTLVVVNGKLVRKWVEISPVALTSSGRGTVKTKIALRNQDRIRVSIDGVAIKYITVKYL
ncbi:unannotated protein [freshwater metagenome]|uniref:Unannotated protein n=1 Tax=freshwater metagenome TaxID=449393 RepID=A0A6J7E742_9ZZZZ